MPLPCAPPLLPGLPRFVVGVGWAGVAALSLDCSPDGLVSISIRVPNSERATYPASDMASLDLPFLERSGVGAGAEGS